ncbi:MAG: hypothetical protein AVDCRST_MAG08-2932, partial [uncultured Acetobacteraceae bacterium]
GAHRLQAHRGLSGVAGCCRHPAGLRGLRVERRAGSGRRARTDRPAPERGAERGHPRPGGGGAAERAQRGNGRQHAGRLRGLPGGRNGEVGPAGAGSRDQAGL